MPISIQQRQLKKSIAVEKYKTKRKELKAIIYDKSLSRQQRLNAVYALSQLPRDSSPVRSRRRCQITGRSRGVYRRFEVCRHKIRELMALGLIPGLVKASW